MPCSLSDDLFNSSLSVKGLFPACRTMTGAQAILVGRRVWISYAASSLLNSYVMRGKPTRGIALLATPSSSYWYVYFPTSTLHYPLTKIKPYRIGCALSEPVRTSSEPQPCKGLREVSRSGFRRWTRLHECQALVGDKPKRGAKHQTRYGNYWIDAGLI